MFHSASIVPRFCDLNGFRRLGEGRHIDCAYIRRMARFFSIVAFLLLLVAAPARALDCPGAIGAVMVDKIASGSAKAGQVFRFKTTTDARVGTMPVPAGTIGYGIVRNVDRAGRRDHDGSLALEPRYLMVGSRLLPVTMDPHLPASWSPHDSLIEKGVTRANPISGIVMTGINMVRFGKNITLGPGFAFTVLSIPTTLRKSICPNA
jgi:hypothetical protein